jgi:hypothetical protein
MVWYCLVLWDLTVQIVNQEILQNKSVTEEKYDVVRSSVTQGAVNDNNYSFDAFATILRKLLTTIL